MTGNEKLSLERMAAARAHRDHGEAPERVAERAGMTLDAWANAELGLLAELDAEFMAGNTERLELYDREYRRVWAELTGIPPEKPPARENLATVAAAPAATATPPAVAQATYQLRAAAPPAPAPPPIEPPPTNNLAATANVDLSKIIASLPFRGEASSAPASSPPPQRRRAPVPTGTVDADPKAVLGPATPFEATPVSRRRAPVAATEEADFTAMRAAVTPFDGQRPPPPAPPPPTAGAPERRGPPPGIPTGTMMADASAPMSAATPFKADARASLTGTALADSAPVSRSVPFGQPSNEPALSVEQYAALTAAISKGDKPDATFKRFGINAFQYSHLVTTYSKKFAEDPSLKARFEQLKEAALRNA